MFAFIKWMVDAKGKPMYGLTNQWLSFHYKGLKKSKGKYTLKCYSLKDFFFIGCFFSE